MVPPQFNILDTRQVDNSTELSGSTQQDAILAKHFWMSVQLQPPIESRLVSREIRQRLRTSGGGKGSRATVPDMSRQYADNERKIQMSDKKNSEESLAKFKEKRQHTQEQFAARRCQRLALEKKSGQIFQRPKCFKYVDPEKDKEMESKNIAMEAQEEIDKFEETRTLL